jgi:hypothetical protein
VTNEGHFLESSEPKEKDVRRSIAMVFLADRSAFPRQKVSISCMSLLTSFKASLFKPFVQDIPKPDLSFRDVMTDHEMERLHTSSDKELRCISAVFRPIKEALHVAVGHDDAEIENDNESWVDADEDNELEVLTMTVSCRLLRPSCTVATTAEEMPRSRDLSNSREQMPGWMRMPTNPTSIICDFKQTDIHVGWDRERRTMAASIGLARARKDGCLEEVGHTKSRI